MIQGCGAADPHLGATLDEQALTPAGLLLGTSWMPSGEDRKLVASNTESTDRGQEAGENVVSQCFQQRSFERTPPGECNQLSERSDKPMLRLLVSRQPITTKPGSQGRVGRARLRDIEPSLPPGYAWRKKGQGNGFLSPCPLPPGPGGSSYAPTESTGHGARHTIVYATPLPKCLVRIACAEAPLHTSSSSSSTSCATR